MNRLFAAAIFAACASRCFAQESSLPVNATVTSPDGATSGIRQPLRRDVAVSTAALERMWSVREKMYTDAGVSADRIAKIKDIELQAFTTRQRGEKIDYVALRKQMQEIITPEEQKKMDEARNQRMAARNGDATTATAGASSSASSSASNTSGDAATSPTTANQ